MHKKVFQYILAFVLFFQPLLIFSMVKANSSDTEEEYAATQLNAIQAQLAHLDLDPSGNNALFIGRTEKQGADITNGGSIGPTGLVDSETKWVFLDCKMREPFSEKDLVLSTQDLIYFFKIYGADKFKFKLVVVDSGVGWSVLNQDFLAHVIDWVAPGKQNGLIFEHIPTRIYATCIPFFSFLSNQPWERQQRWDEGKEITVNGLPPGTLRAYPKVDDPYCVYYFNTLQKGKTWDISLTSEYLKQFTKGNSLYDEMGNKEKVVLFRSSEEALRIHLNSLQRKKIEDKLVQYFDSVVLKLNESSHHDAPFVKECTYNPAQVPYWWVATGKK